MLKTKWPTHPHPTRVSCGLTTCNKTLLVLWQLFVFSTCVTPLLKQLASSERSPSSVFSDSDGCRAALPLHTQATRARSAESAFCTSSMLIFHAAIIIIIKMILYRSNLEKQLQQAHYITFFPFGLWQVSATLNRCHQYLCTLCCAGFFLLIPLFFYLKEQTSFSTWTFSWWQKIAKH